MRRNSGRASGPIDAADGGLLVCAAYHASPSRSRRKHSSRRRTTHPQRIATRKAHLGVIGLGLRRPAARPSSSRRRASQVTGIDIDESACAQLERGRSYIQDVPTADVRALGALRATSAPRRISAFCKQIDAVNVCVPTPLSKQRDPDVSYIVAASEQVARHLHPGMLVILESTTYPGTTDELILPMLARRPGMRGAARTSSSRFSPERVDPGNPKFNTRNIPKVGGRRYAGLHGDRGAALPASGSSTVVPVSSPQVAEMVKLLENTFRSVNIGLGERAGADVRTGSRSTSGK